MTREVRLLGAMAVRPAILALVPRFETAADFTVSASWDLNPNVKKRIEADEPFDLVVINPEMVRDLTTSGKVRAGSQVAFGRVAMGIAVKAGSAPLNVASVDAFGRTLKAAASIAYAGDGSSGAYFTGLLDRLGIAADVMPRLVAVEGGRTAAAVGQGKAELGVVPVTSILAAAPDVTLAGRFPAELQSYIDFAIGIGASSFVAGAAKRLAELLTSPAVDDVLAETGVERSPERRS
jgi:molybdate transport system substrate-binding protein